MFSPVQSYLNDIIKQHLLLLYSKDENKDKFPINPVDTIYIWGRNLTEIVSPYLYHRAKYICKISMNSCGGCDICKNLLMWSNAFTCTAVKKKDFVDEKRDLFTYFFLSLCSKWSVTNFSVGKIKICTKIDLYPIARHFNNECCGSNYPHKYLSTKINETIRGNDNKDVQMLLWKKWHKKKY